MYRKKGMGGSDTGAKLKAGCVLPVLAAVFAAVFVSCETRRDKAVEIVLVNNKIEIDGALKAYAELYERETGVKVVVRSFGGEVPYVPNLASIFKAGMEPEIIAFEGISGYTEAENSGRITDLSDEPWAGDTDLAYLSPTDGSVVGFPVSIEGWGLAYNAHLLRKAGVDPMTMVNIEGIKAAFEKIEATKESLGIEAVVSMVAGPGMTWVTGRHSVNAYLALGLPPESSRLYVDMLLDGKVDSRRLAYFAEYMELLFSHSVKETLLSGGYDAQIEDFANGRTVFIHQGNWIDPILESKGVDFEMGFVPHAFLPETTDGIFVGVPSFYFVNARSGHVEEAKRFLCHMATTTEGHDFMVNKAGMICPFRSATLRPSGRLSRAVLEWADSGGCFPWLQNCMPESFGTHTLGPIFHRLACGDIDVDEFARLFAFAVGEIPGS